MKRKFLLFLCVCALTLGLLPAGGLFAAAEEVTAEDFINADNWTNLPGYTYVGSNVPDPSGAKHPAEPTFPETADGVGINYRGTGYYQSGDDNFAGIVFNQKIDISNFSITFTINTLGANSNAAQSEDGWIGIGLMEEPNLWHTVQTANGGAINLMRPGSREISSYIHEIGSNGPNDSINNFAGGTYAAPSANIDLRPATEGSTIRYTLTKTMTGDSASYVATLSQIDFQGDGNPLDDPVISTKSYSGPLNRPDFYFQDDMAYLTISTSTDNSTKMWDFTIKEINGVIIGTQPEEEPLPAPERAAAIKEMIDELQIYEKFDVPSPTLIDEDDPFYTIANTEVDINEVATEFATLLDGMDEEVLNALVNEDDASLLFADSDEYKEFLLAAADVIIDKYDTSLADDQIARLDEALEALPDASTVTAATERETFLRLDQAKDRYNGLSQKAVEIVKNRGDYETIITEYFDPLDAALREIWVDNYVAIAEGIPATVPDITMDNVAEYVIAVGNADAIYQNMLEILADLETDDPDLYQQFVAAKEIIDGLDAKIEAFKGTASNENLVIIESYESVVSIQNRIYYLPLDITSSDAESVFSLVTEYRNLSADLQAMIGEDDLANLIETASRALEIVIDALPAPEDITAENYIQQGYDIAVQQANNYQAQLSRLDADAANVSNLQKLRDCITKIAVVSNPLSAKTYSPAGATAGTEVVIDLTDLFNNENLLDVTYEANVGTINAEEGTWTYTPAEAGQVNVQITIRNEEFNQSAVCEFTLNVAEGTGGNGGGDNGGCNSEVAGTASLVAAGVLVAGAAAAAVVFAKKKNS